MPDTGDIGVQRADLFKYSSVKRISKLPVVESGYNYVSSIYTRVKNSNRLIRWSLVNVEGGIQLAVDKSLPTVQMLDMPLTVVDSIICKGLDRVSIAVPAITYPPEQIVIMSKDYVNSNLITPVLKRADSVKQLGLSEANRVGEMAASRLDNALDIADKYVDRFLPDSTDSTDSKKEDNEENKESKRTHAMHHMNRLGKKLQRRLTKRTLMEAEAIKRGSQDLAQALIQIAELLLRDPKAFGDKMKEFWNTLSEDEPENQVPPANLEQLVTLLVRESARRVVHGMNFVASTVPAKTAHAFHYTFNYAQYYTNYFLKVVHLEGAKAFAFTTSTETLSQIRSLVLHLLDILGSKVNQAKGSIELKQPAIATTDSNSNNSSQQKDKQNESSNQTPPKPKKNQTKSKSKSDSSPSKKSTSSSELSSYDPPSPISNSSENSFGSSESTPKIYLSPNDN